MTGAAMITIQRDVRLALALLLFLISAGALLIQTWIATIYLGAAIDENWSLFLELFPSAAPPPTSSEAYCFGKCHPSIPLISGWVGVASFILGVVVLAYSWWVPKGGNPRTK